MWEKVRIEKNEIFVTNSELRDIKSKLWLKKDLCPFACQVNASWFKNLDIRTENKTKILSKSISFYIHSYSFGRRFYFFAVQ